MRCADFQKRWQNLLDARQAPEQDDLLCAHAATCAECGEILQIQTIVFREIELSKSLRQPIAASRSAARYSQTYPQRYSESRAVIRNRTVRALFIGLAVAGSLLLLILPAWRFASHRSTVADRRTRTSRPGQLPQTIWVAKPAASASERDSHSQSSDVATSRMSVSDQEALRKLMQDMGAKMSDVAEEQLEPLDRIAGGFRPIADTLGAAWDALRRSLPVGRSPTVNEPQAIFGLPGTQASTV